MFSSELSVPAWSPLFRGHFDGEPILSGVAQLILLRELLQRHLPGMEFTDLDMIRFKQSAGPQETLRFEISGPDERGQARVTIKRKGKVLTQGVLRHA
jgi:3-hydroxymyristoyl/3-hydroxydecanoyl-(acyl carrier protein) dehydratase